MAIVARTQTIIFMASVDVIFFSYHNQRLYWQRRAAPVYVSSCEHCRALLASHIDCEGTIILPLGIHESMVFVIVSTTKRVEQYNCLRLELFSQNVLYQTLPLVRFTWFNLCLSSLLSYDQDEKEVRIVPSHTVCFEANSKP